MESFILYAALVGLFVLISRENKDSVIGAEVKRKSDAVVEAVSGRFVLKEK